MFQISNKFQKALILLTLMLFNVNLSYSQINISNGSSNTCSETFFDSQGSGNDYNNGENFTYTFTPDTISSKISVNFTSFSTEAGFDVLRIYNGSSTAAPLFGSYSGTELQSATIISTATDGSLTFRFTSDGSIVSSGWEANISCIVPGPISSTAREYEERFETNLIGNFKMIGNVNIDCVSNCPATPTTNNSVDMGYSDIDSDTNTINSSMSNLSIPAGATVKWAGLYWGGVSSSTEPGINAADASLNMDVVKLKEPGATNYTSINASVRDVENTRFPYWNTYLAFADVTTTIQNAGAGDYYVADIMSVTGNDFTGPSSSWSMVVVYEVDGEKSRRINVWDGFKFFGFGDADNFTVTGLDTPNSGAFETHIGYYGMDGERDLIGDFIQLNSNNVTNVLNPSDNVLNGTISSFGVTQTPKNPNFDYNWGVDIDIFDMSGSVPNNATSADIDFGSTNEGIWSGVIVLSNEVALPTIVKTISPETIRLNETSTVTLEVTNPSGGVTLTGVNITDQLPANMVLAATTNASSTCGATSGNVGGDTSITFTGGSIAPGATCTYTFNVVATAIGTYNNVVPNTPTDFSNDQSIVLINEDEDNLIVLNIIEANNDSNSIAVNVGGVVISNVLINDNLAGTTPPSISDVNLTQISTSNPGVTLNTTTGAISVTPSTPIGTYTVVYQICEKLEPTNCETATATVNVLPDNDGDGIDDVTDLDDDNDGILDTVEDDCTSFAATSNPVFSSLEYFEGGVSVPSRGSYPYSSAIDGNIGGDAETSVAFDSVVLDEAVFTFKKLFTGTGVVLRLYNDAGSIGNSEGWKSISGLKVFDNNNNEIFSSGAFDFGASGDNINQYTFNLGSLTSAKKIIFYDIENRANYGRSIRELELTSATQMFFCLDTDNDGIPNHLDTDSDNDGCPDAVEGAGSILSDNAALVDLPGGSTNTPGQTATGSLQHLGTTSDAEGNPIYPSSGSAGFEQNTAPAVTDSSINACEADLSLTKTVNTAIVKVGGSITYTLSVTNNGVSNASGVQVTDALPSGLSFIGASSTAFNNGTNTWTIGTLNSGRTTSIQITANVVSAGIIENKAEITLSGQDDSDSNKASNN